MPFDMNAVSLEECTEIQIFLMNFEADRCLSFHTLLNSNSMGLDLGHGTK